MCRTEDVHWVAFCVGSRYGTRKLASGYTRSFQALIHTPKYLLPCKMNLITCLHYLKFILSSPIHYRFSWVDDSWHIAQNVRLKANCGTQCTGTCSILLFPICKFSLSTHLVKSLCSCTWFESNLWSLSLFMKTISVQRPRQSGGKN